MASIVQRLDMIERDLARQVDKIHDRIDILEDRIELTIDRIDRHISSLEKERES